MNIERKECPSHPDQGCDHRWSHPRPGQEGQKEKKDLGLRQPHAHMGHEAARPLWQNDYKKYVYKNMYILLAMRWRASRPAANACSIAMHGKAHTARTTSERIHMCCIHMSLIFHLSRSQSHDLDITSDKKRTTQTNNLRHVLLVRKRAIKAQEKSNLETPQISSPLL